MKEELVTTVKFDAWHVPGGGKIVKEYVTMEYKLDRKLATGRWTTLSRSTSRSRIEEDRAFWIREWEKNGEPIPELRFRVRPTYHLVEDWSTLVEGGSLREVI